MHDVVVVGYGPVGALLAVRLATAGLDVVVVEREPEPYPLPRGVAADGEVLELLERAVPGSTAGFLRDPEVRFLGADARELGRLRFPVPGLAFFRQPVLEHRLRAAAGALGVEVRLGAALRRLEQVDDAVTAVLDGGTLRARWLVGCDGASSTVRRLSGAGWRGRDLPQRWLVCDVVGPPVRERQLFTYTCDPALPQVDLPLPGGHRWEWLLRGPTPEDPVATAERLLRRDTDVAVEVVRAVEYRFAARRAARWRTGRVLLAGDAAHTLPPFAGQGLGAGLRDAWALAALLARGDLDRYQALREPHLRRMTALSLFLGGVLQTRSPSAAGARDALLRSAFRAPALGPWLRRGGPRPERSGVLEL
ncbi:MAG TPA: FAD-dependent monooxygenase [Mycobacteriales bacterium]|nr:FAD-dependent monooxygenase [Mycobacteriales bacterium]